MKLLDRLPVLAFAVVALPLGAYLQSDADAERAEAVRAKADAPALGFIVVRPDAEARIGVAGVRAAGHEERVTKDDLWHLGSITKSITATLAARLVDAEVVSWDDCVGDRLADVAPDMREEYAGVTLLHLLSHRAGLQPNIPIAEFGAFGQTPEDPIADRAKWVRLALEQEPVGPLGAQYVYSNNGFIVAGAMLEAATGVAWEELVRKEVFEPLGLTSAGFGAPQGAGDFDQPRGHRESEGRDRAVPRNADNPAALGPAGRAHMSLADIARYLKAHVERDADFLKPETFEALHSTHFPGNYALGWVATSDTTRWHNGSNTMWYAEVAFDRESGVVAAVCANDGAGVRQTVATFLGELMKGEE